jgi:SAM-dependent methyltransferase
VPATRGKGLLEDFLAQRRSVQAVKLLNRADASGPILDIGCGAVPTFLMSAPLEHRVGLERFTPVVPRGNDIQIALADAVDAPCLPFKSMSFGAVTLLAVLEHLPQGNLQGMLNEIFRVLRQDGVFILTTPAKGTGLLLQILARIGFVSPIEIGEHEQLYGKDHLRQLLESSDFGTSSFRIGSFELGMNNWLIAHKGVHSHTRAPT